MKVHILIFSIVRDLPYLEYCLKSIRKFAMGFTGVTICVPEQERDAFFEESIKWGEAGCAIINKCTHKFYDVPDFPRLGHIAHQAQKCFADKYVSTDTDLVLFMDSDCIFTEPVTPYDYIVNKRPELLIKEYAKISGNPWQKPTEEILKQSCPYSTMERHPSVHWAIMFPELRAYVEKVHGVPFYDFILTRKPDFPWGVSDHNLQGSFVLNSEWRKDYEIIDVGVVPQPKSSRKLFQFWSLSPIDKPQGTPNSGEQLIPLEKCRSVGL